MRCSLVIFLIACFLAPATLAQQRRTRVDLMVRGGTIVTMDGTRRVIEDGALVTSGGRIKAIGPRAEIEAK